MKRYLVILILCFALIVVIWGSFFDHGKHTGLLKVKRETVVLEKAIPMRIQNRPNDAGGVLKILYPGDEIRFFDIDHTNGAEMFIVKVGERTGYIAFDSSTEFHLDDGSTFY